MVPVNQPLASAFGTPDRRSETQNLQQKHRTAKAVLLNSLSLAELEALAGALLPVLLALFAAGIAGKKAFRFQLFA